jgi:hypothetical protein
MAEFGTVNAGSKTIHLYEFSGEVVEQQKSSYTRVTNSSNNYQQQVSTTNYNKIFVRAADGSERSIEIVDSGFSARSGSKVSIIWGILSNKEEGPYLAVVNHDTSAIHTIRKPINDLASPPLYNMQLIIASIFIAVGVVDLFSGNLGSAFFMVAIGGGWIYWIYSRQKALLAKVRAAALALRPWG